MTIPPYAAGSMAARRSGELFVSMRRDLDALQRQLSTGVVADSYAGLGMGRRTSLDARGQLATLQGYTSVIGDASMRIKLMVDGIERLVADVRNTKAETVPPKFDIGSDGRTSAQRSAANRLQLAVDVLNTEVNGRALFGGRAVDRPPVESVSRLLDGAPGQAGLKTLIAERKAADLGGAPSRGRLDVAMPSATEVRIGEPSGVGDARTRANFGFILTGATSSNPAAISVAASARAAGTVATTFAATPKDGDVVRIWVNRADGGQELRELIARTTPAVGSTTEFAIGADATAAGTNLQAALAGLDVGSVQAAPGLGLAASFTGGTAGQVTFAVTAPPQEGDVLRVTVGLRDGTQQVIELTAKAGADPASTTEFASGGSPAAIATAIQGAVGRALERAAATSLSAASTMAATKDFFDGSGSPGREPRRVSGTGFASVPAGNTMIWYKGDDTAPSARDTSPVQIDHAQSVGIGAQANEEAFRTMVAGLAALVAESFTPSAIDEGRYGALSERVNNALAPPRGTQTVEEIAAELGAASAAMAGAKDRHASAKVMLEDAIGSVEEAKPEAVAAAMLALQTRLQASYQTTSMLSRLSLVNFI